MTRRRSAIGGLDGLRTLALLGVLIYHAFPRALPGGYFGVVLFFVISGFLTALSSVRRDRVPLFSYWGRRLVRIYPSLVIMLFVTVEALALADKFKLMSAHEEITSILLAYNNYWQISKQADYFANLANTSAFTHLWYIAILVQFEVVWPILYASYRQRRSLRIFGILTVVSLLIMPVRALLQAPQNVLYYGTECRVHALLLGALAGLWYGESERRGRRFRIRPVISLVFTVLFVAVTVFLYMKVPGTEAGVYRYGLVLYALFCTLMVIVCAGSRKVTGTLLDLAPCRFLSKYSYEIYLWQYPVFFVGTILKMTSPWAVCAEIIIVLILSIWTNTFTNYGLLPKRKTSAG